MPKSFNESLLNEIEEIMTDIDFLDKHSDAINGVDTGLLLQLANYYLSNRHRTNIDYSKKSVDDIINMFKALK